TIMQKCDFAIARAGASTLWELAANGLPTLFVPYPYAADNHQYYNAKFLADSGLAYLIEEKSLRVEDVIDILDKCDLSSKSEKLLKLIEPNGAREIAQLLEGFNSSR
ncbi:MAG TPA: UDP-N-acetylglucosamine--N-acetylmuramyl-(pentapeptide) pyrophosphoryl-undecaprenol N-acetylglucosamine transferase, partial [Nitratifractor sp.]|nr:UDP-N-acetylglucosamine--N-acetylmuramyl-(pentapeptide) pyrophosphoryl-undecaprenol N-acetylglucosamine transferase [Nitratifractor sp.]